MLKWITSTRFEERLCAAYTFTPTCRLYLQRQIAGREIALCNPVAAVTAVAAIGSAVLSSKQAKKGRKLANNANMANEKSAADQAQRSEQQFNKLNQKQPGIAAMLAGNRALATKGIGSTFLTGPKGIPTTSLPLGGTSFLGG